MLETMHRDANANLYIRCTFLKSMHGIDNFYADALMWIIESYYPLYILWSKIEHNY